MTPMVRGDTLNGIVEATAREKIIEFKKNPFEKRSLYRRILADVAMYTNLFQKLKELDKVSSFCKSQLFAVSYKEMAAIKKTAKLLRGKSVNELIHSLYSLGFLKENLSESIRYIGLKFSEITEIVVLYQYSEILCH